ncbi:MAG: CHC2 zinc finger domain-containing protein [Patescibacteria group bacterium]
MKYSRKFIEYLRKKLELVDVIRDELGTEVKFKKVASSGFLILCPFHDEKTPSFRINSKSQYYHCYGCGISGGVFDFIMKIKEIDFPEAIKYLIKKYKMAGCK